MFQKLLGDKVLLEKPTEEKKEMDKTEGGLWVPQSQEDSQSSTQRTKVVQTGVDCQHVQSNDDVLYDVRLVYPIRVGGKDYLLTREESIVGIF